MENIPPLSLGTKVEQESLIPEPRRLPVQFTGSASEYFRIWIVNVALSIVTLGIYSAWAKVRTKNYFYRHTMLERSCFEYHAVPMQILKGRIIVGAGLAAIFFAKIYSLKLYAVLLLLLVLLSPAIFALALAFNARNSSYRNVRFGFDGTVGAAYKTYLAGMAVYIVTLGLGFPYFQWRIVDYWASNHRYGNQHFHFNMTSGPFFGIYARALGIMLLPIAGFTALMVVFRPTAGQAPVLQAPVLLLLVIYPIMFLVVGYVKARQSNLVLGSISLSPAGAAPSETSTHRLAANQKVLEVIWLMVSNLVGIVLTIGLLIPWAKVRTARYRAEHLYVIANGELVAQGSAAPSGNGVLADAATDLGDIGFDLGI